MTAPEFIIAGAMRAGTTVLAEAIAEHPSTFVTSPKEPNYFAVAHGALDFSGPGDQWFAGQNSADWESYQRLFPESRGIVRGEASAMYLALPGVARDIAGRCPQVKIILILRDPVERAYSAWLFLRSKGREGTRDFSAALEQEEGRRAQGYGPMWWYVGASRYDIGLAEFCEAFPADRLLVLTNEELRRDPSGVLAAACTFIGVDAGQLDARAQGRTVNGSGVPTAELLTRALYPSDRLRRVLSRVAPPPARRLVQRARKATVRSAPPMSDAVRRELTAQLHGVADRVRQWTGADTSPWQQ
jgi:hypothetical protein